jgi:hypothetical protein
MAGAMCSTASTTTAKEVVAIRDAVMATIAPSTGALAPGDTFIIPFAHTG